jgi:hypothetical protein
LLIPPNSGTNLANIYKFSKISCQDEDIVEIKDRKINTNKKKGFSTIKYMTDNANEFSNYLNVIVT